MHVGRRADPDNIEIVQGQQHAELWAVRFAYVKILSYHRFKGDARQRHPSARYGQEKRRRWPPRNEKCAACLRTEFALAPHLGAGAKEVCAPPRDGSRIEDAE